MMLVMLLVMLMIVMIKMAAASVPSSEMDVKTGLETSKSSPCTYEVGFEATEIPSNICSDIQSLPYKRLTFHESG